ncbi:MAG TPA: hypothetical protein VGU01_05470 [Sphingomicrobium sp.]|nr:hypothetical protein [Sphingomicrobium sp.]
MSDFDVTLVTYSRLPHLTPDDRLLAVELERRCMSVRAAVWSDEAIDWSASTLTVLRSTWDYFHGPVEFLAWLDAAGSETSILNSPALIRWNHDKHYLDSLDTYGVPTVPTVFADKASSVDLAEAAAMFETTELVIKPAIGGAAHGARRFAIGRDFDEAVNHLERLTASGCALIQPFFESILTERERSLVFLGSSFSHAYLKPPFSAGSMAGEAGEVVHVPEDSEFELARRALASLDEVPAYARVDMALRDGRPHLMELELIEPALHFHLAPGSEAVLADSLQRKLSEAAPKAGRAA